MAKLPTRPEHEDQHAVTLPPWANGGGPAYEEEGAGVNWRRYVAALLRYKWIILVVTVAGTVAGVFGSRFVPPTYLAQASVWVRTTPQGQQNSGPIQSAELLRSQAWVELLRSYEVLDHVVRELRLYVQPDDWQNRHAFAAFGLDERFRPGSFRLQIETGRAYGLYSVDGVLLARGQAGDSVGRSLGFLWVPPDTLFASPRQVGFTVVPPRDAARRINEAVRVPPVDRDGNFLRLEMQGGDPERIADVLNTMIERFVGVATELKREQLTARRQILEEQLAIAAQAVNDAEQALEEFRVRTITLPSEPGTPVAPGLAETRDPVFENFFSMQVEREALQRDRAAIRRVLDEAAVDSLGGAALDGLHVIGAVQGSADLSAALSELTNKQAELRTLRYRYTEEHALVQQTAQDLRHLQREEIPLLARQLAAELLARETVLDNRIVTASRELQEIPARAIVEGRLRRELAIAGDLYTDLQSRFGEAQLAEASSFPDVSILDRAVAPQSPVRDDKMRIVFLAFALSFGVGVMGSVLLDRLDRRVRYPEQVTEELGLPILGAIQRISDGGRRAARDRHQLVEAIRGIRLGLTHAYGSAGPLVVTITSPGPGDGKSFLARHLATAYAEAGHRTLLVDGDIRRGELHRPIEARRRPGLTEHLRGDLSRDAVVQSTRTDGLFFIGAGTRMHDGPELLASPSMAQLLIGLRGGYGVIIVDSPPLSAGVDPLVLGAVTGAILLVLRTGVTDRELAGAKMEMLGRLPTRVLGAVLNDIRPNGQYRYYAYQYYAEGYDAQDEVAVVGGREDQPGIARLPRGA